MRTPEQQRAAKRLRAYGIAERSALPGYWSIERMLSTFSAGHLHANIDRAEQDRPPRNGRATLTPALLVWFITSNAAEWNEEAERLKRAAAEIRRAEQLAERNAMREREEEAERDMQRRNAKLCAMNDDALRDHVRYAISRVFQHASPTAARLRDRKLKAVDEAGPAELREMATTGHVGEWLRAAVEALS